MNKIILFKVILIIIYKITNQYIILNKIIININNKINITKMTKIMNKTINRMINNNKTANNYYQY